MSDSRDGDKSGNATDLAAEINERLERIKEGVEKIRGKEKPSRVVYCTQCDQYAVGDDLLPCDPKSDALNEDHFESLIIGDCDENSIGGYIEALEWVIGLIDEARREKSKSKRPGQCPDCGTIASPGWVLGHHYCPHCDHTFDDSGEVLCDGRYLDSVAGSEGVGQ